MATGRRKWVVEGRSITTQARISPDGKWVAFANADAGRFEVFLANYPMKSGRWPVWTNGGVQPKWNPAGNELFYLGLDGRLMAVPVGLGALPEIGKPQELFQTGAEAITGLASAPVPTSRRMAASSSMSRNRSTCR